MAATSPGEGIAAISCATCRARWPVRPRLERGAETGHDGGPAHLVRHQGVGDADPGQQLGIDEVVGTLRERHRRQTVRQDAEHRAGSGVVHHRRTVREHLRLRHVALDRGRCPGGAPAPRGPRRARSSPAR